MTEATSEDGSGEAAPRAQRHTMMGMGMQPGMMAGAIAAAALQKKDTRGAIVDPSEFLSRVVDRSSRDLEIKLIF